MTLLWHSEHEFRSQGLYPSFLYDLEQMALILRSLRFLVLHRQMIVISECNENEMQPRTQWTLGERWCLGNSDDSDNKDRWWWWWQRGLTQYEGEASKLLEDRVLSCSALSFYCLELPVGLPLDPVRMWLNLEFLERCEPARLQWHPAQCVCLVYERSRGMIQLWVCVGSMDGHFSGSWNVWVWFPCSRHFLSLVNQDVFPAGTSGDPGCPLEPRGGLTRSLPQPGMQALNISSLGLVPELWKQGRHFHGAWQRLLLSGWLGVHLKPGEARDLMGLCFFIDTFKANILISGNLDLKGWDR